MAPVSALRSGPSWLRRSRGRRERVGSEKDYFQAGNLTEAASIARGDPKTDGQRGGSDQKIMRRNARSLRGKARPERSVQPCRDEVKREDGQHVQESLDKGFPTPPLSSRRRSMDAVQQLGGGDRGNAHRFLAVCGHNRVEIQGPPFGGDQDRRVDQRPHGDRGNRP